MVILFNKIKTMQKGFVICSTLSLRANLYLKEKHIQFNIMTTMKQLSKHDIDNGFINFFVIVGPELAEQIIPPDIESNCNYLFQRNCGSVSSSIKNTRK